MNRFDLQLVGGGFILKKKAGLFYSPSEFYEPRLCSPPLAQEPHADQGHHDEHSEDPSVERLGHGYPEVEGDHGPQRVQGEHGAADAADPHPGLLIAAGHPADGVKDEGGTDGDEVEVERPDRALALPRVGRVLPGDGAPNGVQHGVDLHEGCREPDLLVPHHLFRIIQHLRAHTQTRKD